MIMIMVVAMRQLIIDRFDLTRVSSMTWISTGHKGTQKVEG